MTLIDNMLSTKRILKVKEWLKSENDSAMMHLLKSLKEQLQKTKANKNPVVLYPWQVQILNETMGKNWRKDVND